MRKKQVYDLTEIDGLKKEDFPVVDILRRGNERIGCASVGLLNVVELLDCRKESEKRSELLLTIEDELESQNGVVNVQTFLKFADSLAKNRNLECLSCFEAKPNLQALLFLLVNGFCFLIYNNSLKGKVGHIDVIWWDKATKEICFNAWAMNQDEFEGLVYHDKAFLICLRDLQLGRFVYFQKDLKDLTVILTDEQKVFLQNFEIALLEKPFDEIHLEADFINLGVEKVLKSKVELLEAVKVLPESYLAIFDR